MGGVFSMPAGRSMRKRMMRLLWRPSTKLFLSGMDPVVHMEMTWLAQGERWLNRWQPSMRLNHDPLATLCVAGRYVPVSIANWKLIPGMARLLLAMRVPRALAFTSGRRLTVVIPYRDRKMHLDALLPLLKERLREQGIEHRLLVVEQQGAGLFNRGWLLNVGMRFVEDSTDYYCLHDVDMLPLQANYECPSQPVRLVSRLQMAAGPTRCEDHYFSGAVTLRKEQALAANGFSNGYWGWGKEDDDFFFRLLMANCLCYADQQGLYQELANPAHQQFTRRFPWLPVHVRRNRRRRSRLLRGLADPQADGLSTCRFDVVDHRQHALYEHLQVRWATRHS